MRRFRWLPWVYSAFVVAGANVLLSDSLQAGPLDEAKVQRTLMQRFDENRNDKLDTGEARQARARLKNLMEDKSEREINILTWRDDVRELLQSIDQDNDNRLTIAERDAGRNLLDGLIPQVEPLAPKEREAASSNAGRERATNNSSTRTNRGSSGSYGSSSGSYGSSNGGYGNRGYGGSMGGGGFGNSGGGFSGGGGGFSSGSAGGGFSSSGSGGIVSGGSANSAGSSAATTTGNVGSNTAMTETM